ncbi:hypothetical protein H9P43_008308 [Blastocladiella emersonii ATCC 22665]|nr:hypothetical protein H9P43_008308 [Blastocladiella emersonii ATCC 22665]
MYSSPARSSSNTSSNRALLRPYSRNPYLPMFEPASVPAHCRVPRGYTSSVAAAAAAEHLPRPASAPPLSDPPRASSSDPDLDALIQTAASLPSASAAALYAPSVARVFISTASRPARPYRGLSQRSVLLALPPCPNHLPPGMRDVHRAAVVAALSRHPWFLPVDVAAAGPGSSDTDEEEGGVKIEASAGAGKARWILDEPRYRRDCAAATAAGGSVALAAEMAMARAASASLATPQHQPPQIQRAATMSSPWSHPAPRHPPPPPHQQAQTQRGTVRPRVSTMDESVADMNAAMSATLPAPTPSSSSAGRGKRARRAPPSPPAVPPPSAPAFPAPTTTTTSWIPPPAPPPPLLVPVFPLPFEFDFTSPAIPDHHAHHPPTQMLFGIDPLWDVAVPPPPLPISTMTDALAFPSPAASHPEHEFEPDHHHAAWAAWQRASDPLAHPPPVPCTVPAPSSPPMLLLLPTRGEQAVSAPPQPSGDSCACHGCAPPPPQQQQQRPTTTLELAVPLPPLPLRGIATAVVPAAMAAPPAAPTAESGDTGEVEDDPRVLALLLRELVDLDGACE